jgi:4a-hydroxytetrahydrobiopterin dehydratase
MKVAHFLLLMFALMVNILTVTAFARFSLRPSLHFIASSPNGKPNPVMNKSPFSSPSSSLKSAAGTESAPVTPMRLPPDERKSVLTPLLSNGWEMVSQRDAIKKKYAFQDFRTAMAFLNNVAMIADNMNHHPEWLNVYNRVEVTLSTHDCNGLSMNDVTLATDMDAIASKLPKQK